MSTIKATNIQPQSDSDPLVFSTNATEKLRIPSTGAISLTGGAVVSGGMSVSGGISVTGNAAFSGKITTASTTGSDSSTTLATKGYVDPTMPRVIATITASGTNNPTIAKEVYGNWTGSGISVSRVTTGQYRVTFPSGMFSSSNYTALVTCGTSAWTDLWINVRTESATSLLIITGAVGGSSFSINDLTGNINIVVYP
jgi:hypothetical protein